VDGREQSGAELVRQVRRRLNQVGWGANGLGALVVAVSIGFLIPVFIDPDEVFELALFNAPIVVLAFVVTGLTIQRQSNRNLARTVAWMIEEREPDEREHRRTLNLAMYGVKLDAIGWIAIGILFSTLNAVAHSWGFAAVVGATIWLGAETTCALIYLALERALRPVTARALEYRVTETTIAPGVRDRLAWAWALGTGVPLLGVLVVGTVGLTKSGVDTQYVGAAVLFLALVAYGAGTFATLFAAKAISDPVTSVRAGLQRVERGDLDVRVPVDDGSEVGLLQAGFNRMADGLRDREQIRDLFGRHVGEDVARTALRDGTRLGGEERKVGALFIDLVGSTSLALSMPPTEVVRLLNRFFRVVVEVTEESGGLVNKFEGDAALCVFGAPVASDDPAGDALGAARRIAERLRHEVRGVDFGIGVSAGTAVAGNVGAEQRFEYTVIGDPVNEAARLSELAKEHSERLLASETALDMAGNTERSAWRSGDSIALRGRGTLTGLAHPVEER
jgi:adenylate cyclase